MLAFAFLLLCATHAYAYPSFRDEIPNGKNVPNPCDPSLTWNGVGHQNHGGGGTRNPFGLDFFNNGKKWTEALCRKDSDGDGKTNGAELGDPDCVWSKGKTPARTTGLSHPGVCDPVDSIDCKIKNGWNTCPKPFNCSGFNEPGVIVKNYTLTKSPVPAKETTYICQFVELELTGKVLHLVGSEPVIDNAEILHHMILYGCPAGFVPPSSVSGSFECQMSNYGCNTLWDLWGFGVDGMCLNEKEGLLFNGTGGNRVFALLQLHWNNPGLKSGLSDGSGLQMYFTEKLRPNNAGIAMYGQVKLALPPNQKSLLMTHTCPSDCSKEYMKSPSVKNISMALIHMHTYGMKGRVSLWRNGTLVKDLVPLHTYDYNTPMIFNHDPPVPYMAGDEIKTDCYFTTEKQKSQFVYFGDGTQDEMCFSFFRYYPNDLTQTPSAKLDDCVGWGELSYCALSKPAIMAKLVIQGCRIADIYTGEVAKHNLTDVNKYCSNVNMFGESCDPNCKAIMQGLYKQEPCLDPKRGRTYMNVLLSASYLGVPSAVRTAYANVFSITNRCEAELISPVAEPPKSEPTAEPTSEPRPEPELSQEQTFILIIVGTVLAALVLIVLLGVLAMKLRGHASSGNSEKYAISNDYNSAS